MPTKGEKEMWFYRLLKPIRSTYPKISNTKLYYYYLHNKLTRKFPKAGRPLLPWELQEPARKKYSNVFSLIASISDKNEQ